MLHLNVSFFCPSHAVRLCSQTFCHSPAVLHTPLVEAGHLVSVLMPFSSQVAGPATRGSRLITKKAKVTKSDHIHLSSCSCIDFISKILAVHDLGDQFSPGIHQGPAFKMYW